MIIVPIVGSHSTNHWYAPYQCLVRTLPSLGSNRTAVQHGRHSVYLIGAIVFQSVRIADNLYLTTWFPKCICPIAGAHEVSKQTQFGH
ncbi:MAG: hypothetical protein SPI30_00510 [Prevotella sp.]|nr:hypothetical protein [Prevotella sp.]